jgi:hypothetical protein
MQSKYIKKKSSIGGLYPLFKIVDVYIFIAVTFSFLYTVYESDNKGYMYLCLLPIAYGIAYFFVLRRWIYKKLKIFLTIFTGATFIRYVCMPIIIVLSGYYEGRSAVSPTYESFQAACLLMIYELFIAIVLIELLQRKSKAKTTISFHMNFDFPKYTIVYLMFIGITLILSFLKPQSYNLFSFISPRLSGAEHLTSPPFLEAIIIYMIFTCKHLIFVLLLTQLFKKYKYTNQNIYQNIAFFIVLVNISVFYGLNRSDLVMPAIASILLYILLFRDKNIIKYVFTGFIVFILVSLIAESRELASVSRNQNSLVDIADFIQGYFGGVYNVAISIETYEYFPESRSFIRVLYDTLRPFIGFNVLLKNIDITITNLYFNQRLWFSYFYSQIIPMVGQGYIHFGFIFAPLLDCIIISIAHIMENQLNKSKRIEVFYFFSICLIRMAFLMGQNTGNISNEISMNLVMFGVIYQLNNRILLKEKSDLNVS